MADEQVTPDASKPNNWIKSMELATKAINFQMLLVGGLIGSFILILVLTSLLAKRFGTANNDLVETVVGFYKDSALIILGALANTVQHRAQNERSTDTEREK